MRAWKERAQLEDGEDPARRKDLRRSEPQEQSWLKLPQGKGFFTHVQNRGQPWPGLRSDGDETWC